MENEIQKWLHSNILNEEFIEQLKKQEQKNTDWFKETLQFGTGGMRGVIGPGPNAINEVTIGRVTAGLADYCHCKSISTPMVIIAYDNRKYSKEFAHVSAKILSGKNVNVYIFSTMMPTPILSYAIRKLGATAGIMITASHNSGKYNGFKVYDSTGCQFLPEKIGSLSRLNDKYKDCFSFEINSHNIKFLDKKIQTDYMKEFKHFITRGTKEVSVAYSPLHGTGSILMHTLLKEYGFDNTVLVAEQWNEDPNFTNTLSPNPEDISAFDFLKIYGEKKRSDLLLATDPDADRLGAYYLDNNGCYQRLTGNQIGAIMLTYLINRNDQYKLNHKQYYMIKTIVSSDLGKKIAETNGIKVIEVLTGFKYIGDVINKIGEDRFLFAYEESFGYLFNPIVRDKDGIQSALLLSEIANSLKENNQNIEQYLTKIYQDYGFFKEDLLSVNISEFNDNEAIFINQLKKELSKNAKIIEDYHEGKKYFVEDGTFERLLLPKEKVYKYFYSNDEWICIRPSGTEPKIKVYFGTSGYEEQSVEATFKKMQFQLTKMIATISNRFY